MGGLRGECFLKHSDTLKIFRRNSVSHQMEQTNDDDTFRPARQGEVHRFQMVQRLVAILFGFLDINMHIPAIHTDMCGFCLTSMKFWQSGVNGNFVDRSCGIEITLSSPQ